MKKLADKIVQLGSKSGIQFILFAGFLWLVFVQLEINRHFKKMIIGYHYWRKSDTYAQISNYYYNGLQFFDHSIYYNQLDGAGRAVAEFPLFYYFIAIQQYFFGHHAYIAKINWIVLLFFGLFALFKITFHYLNHFGLSLVVALSAFISPVFAIYIIDYLPDPVAFNFIFIGLWFWLKSTQSAKKGALIWGVIFISLAGMMKPFFLIPYLAVLCTMLANTYIFKRTFPKLKCTYLIPLLAVIAWFIYKNVYNHSVGTDYFLANPRPIWNYSANEIWTTLQAIQAHWLADYIHPYFRYPFLILILIGLIWRTQKTVLFHFFYVFSVLGSIAFILLFFNMFDDHDYYVYPILFLIPLTLGKFIFQWVEWIDKKWFQHALAGALGLILFFGLSYTWQQTQARRMVDEINATYKYENYQNTEAFLNAHGVTPDQFVVAFSDKSPSFALSLMNRKGWSGFQSVTYKWKIMDFVHKGASFLILNNRAQPESDSTILDGYTDYPIADTNDIYLYDLRPYL